MSAHALATKTRENPWQRESMPRKTRPDIHHWRQTGPALHYPLQHYCATRKQSAGQNSPDIRKGRNNLSPKPNLVRWPHSGDHPMRKPLKLENGTPLPTTGRKKVPPPRTTDMKHSITVRTTQPPSKWTQSIPIKTEAYKPPVRQANPQ